MKRLLVGFLIVLATAVNVQAADITLKWDAVTGATGYKIYTSTDGGTTFGPALDVGSVTTRIMTGQADNVLILYKVSAYNASAETVSHWQGAWYDGRKKPPGVTGGLGIQ